MGHLANIDIGACVARSGNQSATRVVCLGSDGLNYCCRHLERASDLTADSGERACCSYDQYGDQLWASLATIRGLLVLLCIIFTLLLLVLAWLFCSTLTLGLGDLRARRREIIRHLLREQILHKPAVGHRHHAHLDRSLYSHLKNISSSLSSSAKRLLFRRQQQEKQKKHPPPPSRPSQQSRKSPDEQVGHSLDSRHLSLKGPKSAKSIKSLQSQKSPHTSHHHHSHHQDRPKSPHTQHLQKSSHATKSSSSLTALKSPHRSPKSPSQPKSAGSSASGAQKSPKSPKRTPPTSNRT